MKAFWTWLRSNPYFMAGIGAATGTALNTLHQEVLAGRIDWSLRGWGSLGMSAIGSAILAIYALYTHTPATAAAIASGKLKEPSTRKVKRGDFKRGAKPSPRHRLASAAPHVVTTQTPLQFLWKPAQISMWANDIYGDCTVAEEAFAKSASVDVFVSDDDVIAWAQENGAIDGDTLIDVLDKMQTGGFAMNDASYNDGPPVAVDWTIAAALQNAIAQGPVKIGVAADQLENTVPNPPTNSWIATGFTQDQNLDHCVSLCGYGTIAWLAGQLGVTVPEGVDGTQPAYALFTWDSIGIIDVPSLLAICGEAWLRNPTTVVATAKTS